MWHGRNLIIIVKMNIESQNTSLPDVQIGTIDHDILMTSVGDISKGQTYMSYNGELQTLIILRHQMFSPFIQFYNLLTTCSGNAMFVCQQTQQMY